jgi:ribonuclease BN (tRNA processing enzyme)
VEIGESDVIESVFDKFMSDKVASQKHHNILDLNFFPEHLTAECLLETEPTDLASHVQSNYLPKNGFYDQFESQGGVKQFIAVTLASLTWWKDQAIAESWRLWLKEIDSFSEIPLFFQSFLKNKSCKELLFKVLSGEPDKDVDAGKWEQEQKDAVQVNYKILAEIFGVSDDKEIR